MLGDQRVVVTSGGRIVIEIVRVIRIYTVGQRRRKLPERIICDARIRQRSRLPRLHPRRLDRIRRAVLLEDDGLPSRAAKVIMVLNPGIPETHRIRTISPALRIKMKSTVVKRRNSEVLSEVDALIQGVSVGAVAARGSQPALVAERDHVL